MVVLLQLLKVSRNCKDGHHSVHKRIDCFLLFTLIVLRSRRVGNSRFGGVSCLNLGIKYSLNALMVLQPLKELLGFDGRTR
jgi:hypothetical protein